MMVHILRYINQTPERAPVQAPDMIGVAGGDVPQQIRVNLVTGRGPAQMRFRINRGQAHLTHITLHPLTVDRPIGLQQSCDFA